MAESSQARYRQEALRALFDHAEGWKLVLERVFAMCKEAETTISNPQWPDGVRHDAIGRKNALLGLVEALYREAGIPSPFEEHYGRLIAAMKFTPRQTISEEAASPPSPSAQQQAVEGHLQRRRAGGVA